MKNQLLFILAAASLLLSGCGVRKGVAELLTRDLTVNMMLPDDEEGTNTSSNAAEIIVDKVPQKGDILMNATTNEKGETVITDVIAPTTITAKFIHKPERFGQVDIEFIIKVPASFFKENTYQVRVFPELQVMNDTIPLDAFFLTGDKYREFQNSQYAKFEKYKSTIITNDSVFVRKGLLEKFRHRNIPDGFEEKGEIYGVTYKEAEDHYVHYLRKLWNQRKLDDLERKKSTMVTCPIVTENIVKDSITVAGTNDVYYRYLYKLKSRPGLKKVVLSLYGGVFQRDEQVYAFESPDVLTYYISSITTLMRETDSTDPTYLEGIRQLKNMEYDKAAETLRPYKDFNSALALLAMSYNYAAFRVLESLPKAGDVCFLKAIAYLRLKYEDKALETYKEACKLDKSFISRGNLDPEISVLKKKFGVDDMAL